MANTSPDIKKTIESTAEALAKWQNSRHRDFNKEMTLATQANEVAHSRDVEPDFVIHAEITAKRILMTDYLPRTELEQRPDLAEWASRNQQSAEIKETNLRQVASYFKGFRTTGELGYENELGTKWLAVLGDNRGHFYIPVEALQKVNRISL